MLSPKLTHTLGALATTATIALSGCGGGDDEASSPLDEALGHLPADAGFAFVVSTDLGDYEEARKLIDKFPFGGQIQGALEQSLEGQGINFKQDLEPILGNELVIGVDDNASFTSNDDTPFVMAGQAEDGGKLRDLVEKDAEESGEREGYDLYTGTDDTFMAIKGDVFVLSDDEDTLNRALDRRGGDDRLTEDDVEAAFADLPEDAPAKVYADIAALLASDPDAKEALKVKWVESIETLGMAANANENEVTIDYSLRTDSEGLSEKDLPMATGGEAPQLLERESGSSEVVLGLRDPSQVFDFGVSVARALDPAGYAQFETGKEGVGRRLGINVDDDVLAQLTGDVAAVVRLNGDFGVRAALEDANAFEGTLKKIMDGLPEFSDDVTVTRPRAGDRFYGVAADGKTYAIGVADGALVVANDAGLASQVATRGLVEAEGQQGAFVSEADAERIANELIAQFAGGLQGIGGSLFTGPLGDLMSSAEASTEGITGSLRLEIE